MFLLLKQAEYNLRLKLNFAFSAAKRLALNLKLIRS